MKTKIWLPLFGLVMAASMFCATSWRLVAAPVQVVPPTVMTGPLNMFFATVILEGNPDPQVSAGVFKTEAEMEMVTRSNIERDFPGAKIKSLKIDQVSERLVLMLIQSRRGVRL